MLVVYDVISCKRLESPTFIKKPWSCWTLITGRKRRRSNNMEQETARDMVATGASSNLRSTCTKLRVSFGPSVGDSDYKKHTVSSFDYLYTQCRFM